MASDPLDALGSYIRDQRRQAELSMRKLADLAGVSNPYLSQIERGLKRPSAEILQQIARALEVSAESLYVRAGILDEVPESDLIAAIRAHMGGETLQIRGPTLRESLSDRAAKKGRHGGRDGDRTRYIILLSCCARLFLRAALLCILFYSYSKLD